MLQVRAYPPLARDYPPAEAQRQKHGSRAR